MLLSKGRLLAIASSENSMCSIISPSVVLDHRLDGEDLAWVRDHLRRCEDCRQRVEAFRDQLLRPATPGLVLTLRRRASAYRELADQSRRYAVVGLMAILVGAFFVSSSPRLTADALRGAPISSTLPVIGSVEVTQPSPAPSPSATPEPSALPAASQAGTVPAAIVPSVRPAPTHAPAPSIAPVADAPPAVILITTLRSGLAPWTVTADASRSTDTDATGIISYDFDFGDGAPHAWGAAAQHKYCVGGTYRLTVIVTDSAGLRSSAFVYIDVTQPVNQVTC